MKAELVPENGDPPIPITRDLTVIGRREYCDVVIDHAGLSKRHCVLVKTDGLLVVRDLASTNGTRVKGQKIRWAALLPDDRLMLGNYKVRVYLGPDHAPAPSELSRRGGAARRPAAAVAPARAGVPVPDTKTARQDEEFSPPSASGVPSLKPDGDWDVDVESDDNWRDMMAAGKEAEEDDVIIELD